MNLFAGATVAVLDGETLKLFHVGGDASHQTLTALQHGAVDDENAGSGASHPSSSANPDDRQTDKDDFVAGAAKMLNTQVQGGKIKSLVVIAPPKALGELRKHYHKTLSAVLEGEISKEMTGASISEIQASIASA